MTIYITKYVLTKGIIKAEARALSNSMFLVKLEGNTSENILHSKDYQLTIEYARESAKNLIKENITKLKYKIKLMEKELKKYE